MDPMCQSAGGDVARDSEHTRIVIKDVRTRIGGIQASSTDIKFDESVALLEIGIEVFPQIDGDESLERVEDDDGMPSVKSCQ
jgi:hypothetical protein